MEMGSVAAFRLTNDAVDNNFEVTLNRNYSRVTDKYQYALNNRDIKNIRVSTIKQNASETITAGGAELSDKIFNETRPDFFGTIGWVCEAFIRA